MTEQDGADADAAEADAEEPDEPSTADLEDIAEEPDGDADDALAEIVGGPDVDVEVSDELREWVDETDADTVAHEVATLQKQVAVLESDLAEHEEAVDDLESRLARKQADFQNYKKRQEKRLEEEKARATEDLVARLLDVRDNLQRALDQDEDVDIRDGVESTLRQFDEELGRENVQRVEPAPGDAVDPQRHEVLMRVDSDQPEDTVADLHRPGYEMAGKVIREAQVTVSDGPAE
ncbi:nucleotide exchange factor GrpE [Halobacteriales archaeon Cl-PHB]